MNISYENLDKTRGKLTMTVEKADYEADVEKNLKDIRKRANVPGFRPGQVPMGMIRRVYLTSAKSNVITRMVAAKADDYLDEKKIKKIGNPVPGADQKMPDFAKDETFEFVFDIALEPEFEIELTDKDVVDYHVIDISDSDIDKVVENYCSRFGRDVQVEAYDDSGRDLIIGVARELDADGKVKDGGIQVDNVVLSPKYFKDDGQKALFVGKGPGATVAFNPAKAFDSEIMLAAVLKIEKAAAANVKSDFACTIKSVERFTPAEVNQALFDKVFGKGVIDSEAAFRSKIANDLKSMYVTACDKRFMRDAKEYIEKKVGEMTFADDLIRQIMFYNIKEQEKDNAEKYVDENYAETIATLRWHLIKEKMACGWDIKISDDDVMKEAKEAARTMLSYYGITDATEEELEKCAKNLLKDEDEESAMIETAIETKLAGALKSKITLREIHSSLDEYMDSEKEKK